MRAEWKGTVILILQAFLLFAILVPISRWFSVDPIYLFLFVLALFMLWKKRRRLPSRLRRAKVMMIIVIITFILVGSALWWILDNPNTISTFVVLVAFFMVLAFAFYE